MTPSRDYAPRLANTASALSVYTPTDRRREHFPRSEHSMPESVTDKSSTKKKKNATIILFAVFAKKPLIADGFLVPRFDGNTAIGEPPESRCYPSMPLRSPSRSSKFARKTLPPYDMETIVHVRQPGDAMPAFRPILRRDNRRSHTRLLAISLLSLHAAQASAQPASQPNAPSTRAAQMTAAPSSAPADDRCAVFDEIWRELQTHDAFFDATNPDTRQLGNETRAALRETSDETERLRIVIRALSRLGDGHLHLTTRWFLPDRPPPPIELAGGDPMFRPRGGFAKFRRDYYMRVKQSELDAEDAARPDSSHPASANSIVDCRVIQIDGAAVSHGGGWALLNGRRDTPVTIMLERPDGTTATITRNRTEPVVPPKHFAPTTQIVTTRPDGTTRVEEREVPVEFRRLDGDIGYIRIAHLVTTQTIADFNAALDQLMDTNALILDIRGNTGGYPWIMMPIVGRFFSEYQRVCSFDGRSPSIGALVRSVGKVGIPPVGRTYRKPLAVLINDGTASMGEGLAFVLGDTGRAKLIGRPTMGLNAAIRNVTLQNGLVLWHSWIRVNRLNGDHYQGVGVQPHELVQLDEETWRRMGISEAIKAEQELQIQAAKSVLRSTTP